MAKYGKKAQDKVEETMREFKEGTLRSGGSGEKVTNPKQAVAIGLSEAREAGAKVPKKKSTARKSTEGRPAAKSSAAKKAGGRKSSTRKSSRRS
jgi:topoisomerase IA-like protein